MSSLPVNIVDRYGRRISSGSNHRFRSATQSSDRRQISPLDRDHHRTVSSYGRRVMMTIGRWLVSNLSAVRGMVNETSESVSSVYNLQYHTSDDDWNTKTEEAMARNARVFNVRSGVDASLGLMRRNWFRHAFVDGDCFILLCSEPDNGDYPQGQILLAHRIYSKQDGVLGDESGKYSGQTIIDGVIIDDIGMPLAYRYWNAAGTDYIDLPAYNVIHIFDRESEDQIRGCSQLAIGLFDWQDVQESQEFELQAQKLGAAIGLIEHNEEGSAAPGQAFFEAAADGTDISGTATGLNNEVIAGGLIRYFRSNSGANLSSFSQDRPTANQREFFDGVTRACFFGQGLSYDVSMNSTKIGGASLRVQADKVNRKIENFQRYLIEPASRRIDIWRMAKLQALDLVEQNDEWEKFGYSTQGKQTADAKYDSSIRLNHMAANIISHADACSEVGSDEDRVFASNIRSIKKWKAMLQAAGLDENTPINQSLQIREYSADDTDPDEVVEEEDSNNEETSGSENLKMEIDSYGVAVRAGAITPSIADEDFYRSRMGLPPLSEDARETWGKDGNTRRPITITPLPGSPSKAFGQPTRGSEDEDEDA